jgi:molybdenum cofactor cytidylyltransferase
MNASSPRTLQIVVLAAGFSSRLGHPKALARVRGLTLLRRTLIVAGSLGAVGILVVAPRHAARYRIEARGMKVSWATNTERAQGLSSSVRRGIAAARFASAVLLLPVDLVHFTRRDLFRLVRRWQAAPRRLIARRIDSAGGAPVILPRWLYRRGATLAGDAGLRQLIGQLPAHSRVLVDLPSARWDVDTPQDLSSARQRIRSRGG